MSTLARRALSPLLLTSWLLVSPGCLTYTALKHQRKEPKTASGYAIATGSEVAGGVALGLLQSDEIDASLAGTIAVATIGIDALTAMIFFLILEDDDDL